MSEEAHIRQNSLAQLQLLRSTASSTIEQLGALRKEREQLQIALRSVVREINELAEGSRRAAAAAVANAHSTCMHMAEKRALETEVQNLTRDVQIKRRELDISRETTDKRRRVGTTALQPILRCEFQWFPKVKVDTRVHKSDAGAP